MLTMILAAIAAVMTPPPPPTISSMAAPSIVSTGPIRVPDNARLFSAREAVLAAADAPPFGVAGRFGFVVRATGWSDGVLYLNSEIDYRDPRNLSVAVAPELARKLVEGLGDDGQRRLEGRTIIVTGRAKKARIDFTVDGKNPSGKYYFQTQVPVTSEGQIAWVN